jgi:predicted ArsR family transcriptional regulator
MFLKTVRDIAKPQHFAIIELLKRSTGMPVAELGRALKMSYMGVKQHCLDLEKKGWLDTWRRPVPNGRPEKLYRLTPKAASFYPEAGNEMTLELLQSIQEIYGPSAPDKLLFNYFTKKADAYLKKIKGHSIAERATAFAKLRNLEGHCAEVTFDHQLGFKITEFHSPLKEIAAAYPNIRRMEEQMFNRVLMTTVQRLEERSSGLVKHVFLIPTLGHQQAAAS